MIPVGAPVPLVAQFNDPEIILRRQINSELAMIRQVFAENSLQDALTQSISDWLRQFETEFRRRDDMQMLVQEFICKLQELMKDSIREDCHLDEEALLGSDGKPYNSMTYGIYFATVRPITLRFRSPKEPQNPTLFYVSPHPLASCAATWLKQRQALFIPEDLLQQYAQLEIPHIPMVPLPMQDNEPIRQVLLEHVTELFEEAQQLENMAAQLRQAVDQRIQQGLALVRQNVAQNNERNQQALAALRENDAAVRAELRNEMAPLLQQIAVIREQHLRIEDRQEQVGNLIRQGEQADAHLRLQLEQAEKSIADREKKKTKRLGKGLLLSIGCALGTAGVSSLLNSQVAISSGGGGFKVNLILPK